MNTEPVPQESKEARRGIGGLTVHLERAMSAKEGLRADQHSETTCHRSKGDTSLSWACGIKMEIKSRYVIDPQMKRQCKGKDLKPDGGSRFGH